MDLKEIIELAKIIAKPWQIATYVLAFLLLCSVIGNIYLATQEVEILVEQDYDSSNNNTNNVG